MRELMGRNGGRAVLIDTLANTLKARGFRRTPGSPRLVTRLRRMRELSVSPNGMITLVGAEPAAPEQVAPAEAGPAAVTGPPVAPAEARPAEAEPGGEAGPAGEAVMEPRTRRRRSRRGGRRRRRGPAPVAEATGS